MDKGRVLSGGRCFLGGSGSGGAMRRTVLVLLASLAFGSLCSFADGSPMQVLSAPNLLRIGTAENIFVECQDCTGGAIDVEIQVLTFPPKTPALASTQVTLDAETHQAIGQIMIPPESFSKDPDLKQYVTLRASFPGNELDKVVLASFQSGYIFIQTDKTLYTPNSMVHYRMFGLTPKMEPVIGDAGTSISIEIVTPEGITLPPKKVTLESGIYSGNYRLPEITSPGMWKVVTRFNSNPQQSYSAEFEVKEYVLPSFEVKLTPTSPFFYIGSQEFTVNIKATYLFGQEVQGTAFVMFRAKQGETKILFPASLQSVQINNGEGKATLKREHITQAVDNIDKLAGGFIFVSVRVLTESGSEMAEAELRNIPIVTSPYTITFKKTPKYYKPGMSFAVKVEVTNPDGTPANGVPLEVNPGLVRGNTAANGMARLTVNTEDGRDRLEVTARTKKQGIPDDEQATATMTAVPYNSGRNNLMHINVDAVELKLGEIMIVNLNLKRTDNGHSDITWLIMSRGQLIKSGRHPSKGQVLISLPVTITKEMMPSFRIIAYYHTSDDEVVSDSVWVDVEDSCMGSLRLESLRPAASYEPRKTYGLKVTGDPGATVGLVAVDKGVYVLNNKYRLTQKKVWDTVEKFDTGCTAGGGKDGMGVFFDAGLLFVSSTNTWTTDRTELKCPAPSRRRKRSTTIVDITNTLLNKYQDKDQRECCRDAFTDTPVLYDCQRRSEYIDDNQECKDAFLDCCREIESQRAERKEELLQLARSDEDDEAYTDSNDISSRTEFPESWLWMDFPLPECDSQNPNCETTSYQRKVPLKGSITTWQFTGISLSRTHGICVSDPFEVIVRKDFFIDLRLPYSAVRGEQLEVKAILHNYSEDDATVRVDLIEEDHVCSVATTRRKYRQEVEVRSQSTRSVPFILIPMKEGKFNIEVKAAVKDSSLNDGIIKPLTVVPGGVLVKSPEIVILDPKGGIQEETLNSRIPRSDLVPNSPTSTLISVTGREQVSTLVENAISGNSMGSLIVQPHGCGEQIMIHMTLPVIAATYLDRTNQWEKVGFEKRSEALKHIDTGYQKELHFRKNGGSFSAFPDRKSSTWLTAYVAKVFSMAKNFVEVQTNVICDAVKFLIVHAQRPDGMFMENGPVIHGEMIGDVQGADSDASMTAFCLIALQEARDLCSASVTNLQDFISKAVTYLENRLPHLTNPYAVAMTSYALANENKLNRDILYQFSPEMSHWPVHGKLDFTLEATAYALLALVKVKAFEDARPVVRWFNKQQKVGGGYGSTQATIIVYQAVSEYWINAEEPDYDLDVDIQLPGRARPDKIKFNKANHYTTRTSKLNEINQDVTVTAKGTGEATLKMVSLYYALPKEKESDCQKFNLTVTLEDDKIDEEERVYWLKIDVLYKDKERDATMSILDIGLLTGYIPDTQDLNKLAKGRARTISKYEMNTALSEKGSLIIYLDKVSHTQSEQVRFRIRQTMKVGVLQPAAVSVYEYYEQTHCVKFYRPQRRAGELMRLCRKDECTCAEEDCSMQKKGKIDNAQRTAKACETTQTSRIDFVYKVRLEKFEDDLSTDIYNMRILEALKEGSSDVGPVSNLRKFLGYPHCRESLDLQEGKTYLIMGTSKDIYRDDNQEFQYVLGGKTWIEYWPTQEECQQDEYRETCEGMEELVREYRGRGCRP